MLAVFTPETGDADVPIAVFPVFFGPGQMSSSLSWTCTPQLNTSQYTQISLDCPFVNLDEDDLKFSPKKGIGSGSKNSSGGHFYIFHIAYSSSYVSSKGSSETASSMSGNSSASANRSSLSLII